MKEYIPKHLFLLLALFLASAGQAIADDGDKKGDANGDGEVNMTDVAVVVNKFHGSAEPSCPLNADANGDGVINMTDVAVIVNIYHHGAVDASTTITGWTEGNTTGDLQSTSAEVGD